MHRTILMGLTALVVALTPVAAAAAPAQDQLAGRVKALENQLNALQSSLADRLNDLEALQKANQDLQAQMKLLNTKISEQAARITDNEEKLKLPAATVVPR